MVQTFTRLCFGVGLLIKGEVLYAGIAIGIGVREFLLAFKS